jgi:hypothetical protein
MKGRYTLYWTSASSFKLVVDIQICYYNSNNKSVYCISCFVRKKYLMNVSLRKLQSRLSELRKVEGARLNLQCAD